MITGGSSESSSGPNDEKSREKSWEKSWENDWESKGNLGLKKGKNLVVAVDGSEESNLAFQYALEHSRPEDKLQMIHGEHVFVDSDSTVYESLTTKHLFRKFASQCEAENRNCEFETKTYTGGASTLSKGICDYAKNKHADAIIVGSRGYSGSKRILLGSLSSSLAKNCPCSISIIRKPVDSIDE